MIIRRLKIIKGIKSGNNTIENDGTLVYEWSYKFYPINLNKNGGKNERT